MLRLARVLAFVLVASIAMPSFAASPVGDAQIVCTPPEVPGAFACVIHDAGNPQEALYLNAFGLLFVPFGPSLSFALQVTRYRSPNFAYHRIDARVSPAIILLPTGWIWPSVAAEFEQYRFGDRAATEVVVTARNSSTANVFVVAREDRRPGSCTDGVTAGGSVAGGPVSPITYSTACPAPLPDLP